MFAPTIRSFFKITALARTINDKVYTAVNAEVVKSNGHRFPVRCWEHARTNQQEAE
jgi:hypothetical protein